VTALREAGLRVSTAVCVVDREEGGADELARHAVRLRPLLRATDVLESGEKPLG
jgi:orotate phosphoribosyltransferase